MLRWKQHSMEEKLVSFNVLQRICEEHVQDDAKKCYCYLTGNNCNKANCPLLKENETDG